MYRKAPRTRWRQAAPSPRYSLTWTCVWVCWQRALMMSLSSCYGTTWRRWQLNRADTGGSCLLSQAQAKVTHSLCPRRNPQIAGWARNWFLTLNGVWNVTHKTTKMVSFRSPNFLFLLILQRLGLLRWYLCVVLSWQLTGVVGHRTLQKTASTTIFLYFACILPSIALGVLNDTNTIGYLSMSPDWNQPMKSILIFLG